MDILILCRERTEDVNKLEIGLINREHKVTVATPNKLGISLSNGNSQLIIDGVDSSFPNVVFGWVSLYAREQGLVWLEVFKSLGIKVINGWEILFGGQNKIINSVKLNHAKIPHPKTWIFSNETTFRAKISEIPIPCVAKIPIGAKGEGVVLLKTMDEIINYADEKFKKNKLIYIQEYIEIPNRDIRVRVIDYKTTFSFFRYIVEGDFRTNLSLGAKWDKCEPNDEIKSIAEKSALVMQTKIAGVDIIEGEKSLIVLEVNSTPAFTWPNDNDINHVIHLIESQ